MTQLTICTIAEAQARLNEANETFTTLFEHGSLSVEFYRPVEKDYQTPHDRDEVYVIASGSGEFIREGSSVSFNPGDVLFVAAGEEHRFVNFDATFSTWVFFYGPVSGEAGGEAGGISTGTNSVPLRLLTTLQIRNFTALAEFESQAAAIMKDYEGRITHAFETCHLDDDSGEEVHLLEFPDIETFNRYRADPRLQQLQGLRETAIASTDIKVLNQEKHY